MRSEDGAALRQEGHVSVEDKGTRLNMTLLTEGAPALASLSINMALLTEGGGERVPFYKHGLLTEGRFFKLWCALYATLRHRNRNRGAQLHLAPSYSQRNILQVTLLKNQIYCQLLLRFRRLFHGHCRLVSYRRPLDF